jgi:hypothetical protein
MLQSLWDAVQDYNSGWKHRTTMSQAEVAHAVANLDFIYQVCATYMTNRSMKDLGKRKLRYDAFTALIENVAKEIQTLGGKTLLSPADFRQNRRNYWLERLDPEHRAGHMISGKYNTWVTSGSTDTFWTWLNANGGIDIKNETHVAGYENPEGAQWQHCYYFSAGLLLKVQNGTPLCTAGMRTEFSKGGWAVFVCSLPMVAPGGRIGQFIFSYTHRAGYDHHSSFLGGAPVMAAGEWIVDNTGKIRVMTAKSGHYTPEWQNLQKFVIQFSEIPGDALIRPNMRDHNDGADTIKFYRVSDFRMRGVQATPLSRRVVINAIQSTGANTALDENLSGVARGQ